MAAPPRSTAFQGCLYSDCLALSRSLVSMTVNHRGCWKRHSQTLRSLFGHLLYLKMQIKEQNKAEIILIPILSLSLSPHQLLNYCLHFTKINLKEIPSNKGREVRGLLRTRDGQTTRWRDGESVLNHITTGRQTDTERQEKNREREREVTDQGEERQ